MSLVLAVACVLCALLLAPGVLRFCQHIKQVARVAWLTRSVPGPPCWPLVGCLPTFLALWTDMHGTLMDLLQRYGTTIRWRVLDRIVLIVLDPDDVQVVCTHPALANKAPHYQLLQHHLGMGLVNMNGPAYRRHRKAITPSLHLDILHDFVPVFAKNAQAMVSRLEHHADAGTAFNASAEFGTLANMTIMETVLSSRPDASSDKDYAAMADALNDASSLLMWRVTRPWWENDVVFTLCSRYKAFMRTAAALNDKVSCILHAKSEDVANGVPPPPRRRMAFLDHVLRSEESAAMTRAELRDELKTFLFAGSTTSMDFLAMVALMFTMYPDVQRRVQQEVDEIFGAPGTEGAARPVVPEDLGHLEYTERVLREVLRYAPPVPMLFRTATEDVRLASGTLVPKGCMVALVPGGTHRIDRHFPDPLRFDPDRFLGEQARGRHPFAYIPFSAGARNCVGQRYAVMFSKTAVATLMRRYSFVPAPGGPKHLAAVSVIPGITISVRGGAHVRVQRRP